MFFETSLSGKSLIAFILIVFVSLQLAGQVNNITITVDEPISCHGENDGTLTASIATGGSFFQWSNGKNTPTIQNLSAGTYTVTVMNAAGGPSGTASLVLTEPELLSTGISGSRTITCSNNFVEVTSLPTGGTWPYDYTWSAGGVDSTITVTTAGVLVLTISDAHACVTTATFNVPSDFTAPDLAPVDSAVITCAGNNIQLNANVNNASVVGFEWSTVNGEIIGGANTAQPIVSAAGIYEIRATYLPTGCVAVDSAVVSADFLSLATAVTGPYYAGSVDSIGIITSGGAGPIVYEWVDSLGNFVANTPTLYDPYPGNFSVRAVDSTGCVFILSGIRVFSTVGIMSAAEAGFAVAPNPASSEIIVDLPDENETSLQVFNTSGQLVSTKQIYSQRLLLDVNDWNPGIYLLRFSHKKGITAIKVVIAR